MFYYLREDVQFGTETEGYDSRDDSSAPYYRLWKLLPPAFQNAGKEKYGDEGIPFAVFAQKHHYTRWDLGTENTVFVKGRPWYGFELKSRVLRGTEGLQELIDAHALLAENSRRADGSCSFETNETCSFQLHVSPVDNRSEDLLGEPRVAGNFTEREIRNLAYAIARNEEAYKASLAQHRLESRFCTIYSSTEIPDGRPIADILDPAATTLEQVTGTRVSAAMISLANLNPNPNKDVEDQYRDVYSGPRPPPIYTVQFRGKEGVTLSNFSAHALYAAIMVNFVSLALNNPHVTLEEAKRLTLDGPTTGRRPAPGALHGPR